MLSQQQSMVVLITSYTGYTLGSHHIHPLCHDSVLLAPPGGSRHPLSAQRGHVQHTPSIRECERAWQIVNSGQDDLVAWAGSGEQRSGSHGETTRASRSWDQA